jgi:hypothetical protein
MEGVARGNLIAALCAGAVALALVARATRRPAAEAAA